MNKDEMKMDIKEILKKPYGKTITLAEHYISDRQARILYNAGYRKIGDDEIVVTKRQYEQLKKHNTDRKRLRNKWQTAKREAEHWKNRCVEIGDVASRETARMIFQKMKDGIENSEFGYLLINRNNIIELAKNLGIELE